MPDNPADSLTRVDLPLQVRAAQVSTSTVNAEARTAEVVWTTGARVARYSFGYGEYLEELDTSPTAVRLARLNAGAPVLESHRAAGLDSVIGVVEPGTARMAKGEGRATVRFARDDERADSVWRKVEQGIIRAVSVGYRVHKMLETKAKDGSKILRAVDWEPFEISFVAVGADAAAGVRADDAGAPCEIESPTLAARAAEHDAARAEAIAAGRHAADEYAVEILDAVRDAGGSLADGYAFIRRRATIDDVRSALGMRPAAAAHQPGALAARMAARYTDKAGADTQTNISLAERMRQRLAN